MKDLKTNARHSQTMSGGCRRVAQRASALDDAAMPRGA